MATLTAKNLAKAYKGRRVVEDVSLTVNSGEIVGLLGPNGAGKTTTFYMVVGIVPRDAGNIIIDDDDISLLPLHARARRGIGYLPQEASIFRRLSVYDNLMAVLQIRDDLSAEQREDRANELMEEFHIEHLRDSMGQSLSGGERRRVEIARALAANPKFILLFYQVSDLIALNVAINLLQISITRQNDKIFCQFVVHLGSVTFNRFTVVLHLVERCRFTVAVNHFFTLFAARTGNNHFVGINFDGALGDDDITGKGNHVALHIKRLLVRFNVDRLISVSGYGKCRNAGSQK